MLESDSRDVTHIPSESALNVVHTSKDNKVDVSEFVMLALKFTCLGGQLNFL